MLKIPRIILENIEVLKERCAISSTGAIIFFASRYNGIFLKLYRDHKNNICLYAADATSCNDVLLYAKDGIFNWSSEYGCDKICTFNKVYDFWRSRVIPSILKNYFLIDFSFLKINPF